MSLWDSVRRWWHRKTPAAHFAALDKRLGQLEDLERAADAELDRLRARNGQTRAIKKATKRLKRLKRRTDRVRRATEAVRSFVKRAP